MTIRGLLGAELEEEPIPDRRPWRRTPWHGYRHRALLTLADQATDDDPRSSTGARALGRVRRVVWVVPPSDRPGSRAGPRTATGLTWTAALSDLTSPFTALAVSGEPGNQIHPTRRRSRVRVALLGVVGIGLCGFGLIGCSATGHRAVRPRSTSPATPRPAPNAADDGTADVDGDGCPEPVRLGHGWIEVDGRRFRVGRPGNALAVGDWDGDGAATVALLQRRTGDVWRFAAGIPTGR